MKRTNVSVDLGSPQVTIGFWMSLSRALDAWTRYTNARAAAIEKRVKDWEAYIR